MKLFFSPGACSLAPHILLFEAGCRFQTEKVDLKTKQFSGGDYNKINPKGYVPALQLENDEVLTEVTAVLQYIADQNPDAHLLPKAGNWERYRAQEWLNYVATEIHKSFSILFTADRLMPDKEGGEQLKASIREMLGVKFAFLSGRLEQNDFLMGERFTAPDAYLFVCLRWSRFMGIDLGKWPVLTRYVERVFSRPKVVEALKAEGLKTA